MIRWLVLISNHKVAIVITMLGESRYIFWMIITISVEKKKLIKKNTKINRWISFQIFFWTFRSFRIVRSRCSWIIKSHRKIDRSNPRTMNCYLESFLFSFLISFLYVVSLYIYPSNLSRTNPITIRRRFFSVIITVTLELITLNALDKIDLNKWKFNPFNYEFVVQAIIKPIFVLSIIQLVPIILFVKDGLSYGFDIKFDLIFLRNHLIGPVTEELCCKLEQKVRTKN